MRIIDLEEIVAALDEQSALAAVEAAIIAGTRGAQTGDAGHFDFTDPPGDCHVKVAHLIGEEVFAVKVSCGFYDNAAVGLSSSQGFVAVMSARTGRPLALLVDRGHLTGVRTAMTGMLAARAIGYRGAGVVGIVGTGSQARLQADFIRRHLGAREILVWGRDAQRAASLARELGGESTAIEGLCARADLIVTTTPATEPLIRSAWVRPGTRIVAVGSDGGGKRELDAAILARGPVVVDSRAQCLDGGEAGWAVRAGLIAAAELIDLGELLAAPRAFDAAAVVVADLTGLAVEDAAIAGAVWVQLEAKRRL